MPKAYYDILATLVAYPDDEFEANLKRAIAVHAEFYPRAARSLEQFQRLLPTGDPIALRELHTRTFDVQAITSLDIGYTLFGEDYKRGALLANLSGEHTRAGNDCGAELADHLTNVLRLVPKLTDAALCEELVHVLLVPALQQMIREFEPAPLAKKEELYKKHHKTIIEVAAGDTRTAYRHVLEAVLDVLREDFALEVSLPIHQESKFARGVGTELGIESCGGCASDTRGA